MSERDTLTDALRLRVLYPPAKVAWRVSETFEAVGNWLEDWATALEPKPLRWHLKRSWSGATRV